jgi:hypothetical protein
MSTTVSYNIGPGPTPIVLNLPDTNPHSCTLTNTGNTNVYVSLRGGKLPINPGWWNGELLNLIPIAPNSTFNFTAQSATQQFPLVIGTSGRDVGSVSILIN